MGLFRDWGFSAESWRGHRGEYWVVVQGILLVGFALLPIYRWESVPQPPVLYGIWGLAAMIFGAGLICFIKGLLDLGHNLTPLPHPRDDGELVQSGIYGLVRHPLYSGVIFVAIAWALYQWSLSHLLGAIALFVFLDAKARQEENWLIQKYPTYVAYRQQVKKLIPWIY